VEPLNLEMNPGLPKAVCLGGVFKEFGSQAMMDQILIMLIDHTDQSAMTSN
jgi:hypothetical protein